MCLRNTTTSYGSVAKFFHWTISVLVILMLVFGYFLEDVPEDWQGLAYNTNKLTGLLILLLMVLRLFWALMNPKPALPAGTPPWQHSVERWTHFSFYLFVIMMPLAGWIGSCAAGRAPHLGDLQFKLPVEQSKALSSVAFDVHGTVAVILIVLISLHVLAVLYHHFIKHDEILSRMLPGRRRGNR